MNLREQVVQSVFCEIEWKQLMKIVGVAFSQNTLVTTILLEIWQINLKLNVIFQVLAYVQTIIISMATAVAADDQT